MMDLAQKLKEFNELPKPSILTDLNSRVFIVDGLNVFIRAFAANSTSNDNGDHVGGITGFLLSLGHAIRTIKPSRCIIVFDGKGGSKKRREIFPEYKENRKFMMRLNRTFNFTSIDAETESQKLQLIKLLSILEMLPVTVISVDDTEADDVISYLSDVISDRNGETYIMSNDKDFLQLVKNNKVYVYNPVKKIIYTEEKIVEEFGIHPNNFMVYRPMVGDSSDNVPGIKGIGSATLLKHFPELKDSTPVPWEHIFAQCEEILSNKSYKSCELILKNKNLISRNMKLMRLDEQFISSASKIKIINQLDNKINKINELQLTKTFVQDRLLDSFPDLRDWIRNTFVNLVRLGNK